ncbi:TonB-dependent receptor plug domain-containing protein [Litoribacillus peritrichatus]|uniref:TonB-dependent receptor n=1 Tax=Litoribacillus peritrichatus TaxID=718191 RepID=A0ABP7N4I3_9GAMM
MTPNKQTTLSSAFKVLIPSLTLCSQSLLASEPAETEHAMEIVVSASKVEMSRAATGSAMTVLDSEYLEQNQVRTVSDALRDVPGVAVSRNGAAGSFTQVRIRGAEANQTLVLIDGIEVNDVANGSEYNFAHLMSLEIERIEVLRGAQSALWGSDAMGGVINIITKKGNGPLNGKVSFEAGSYGTHQESFNLNSGSDIYHYSLSGSLVHTDGISDANEKDGNHEEDGYRNGTLSFRGGVQANDNLSFELNLRHTEADSDSDSFTSVPGSADPRPRAVDADQNDEVRQKFARLSSNLSLFDDQWQQSFGVSNSDSNRESFKEGTLSSKNKGKRRKYEYQSDVYFESDAASSNVDHRITFAAEREEESFYTKGWSTIDREMDASGFALEYGVSLNDQWFATLAGRRDLNSEFQNDNTYRFTLAGWLSSDLRIHASKGTGIKNPGLYQLYGSSETYKGNENLKPEKNVTWDLGTEYHFDAVDGYIDVTYFHSDVRNMITGAGQTSINLPSDSKIKGVEVSATLNPAYNFRIDAGYTYTDSDNGDGKELVRRAKHIASLNSSYLFPNDKTRITGGVQYNGQQDDLIFDENWNTSQKTLSEFALLNLALSHTLNDQVEFFCRVENLLDEEYEEVATYGTKGINAMVGVTLRGSL